MDSSLSHREVELKAFYWYKIFALDSVLLNHKIVKLAWRLPN